MDDKFVSTSISRMRKKLKQAENKNDARLEEIQDTLDILIAKFRSEALSTQSTKKFDISGFANLVKLQLLLSGNPTEIVETVENSELNDKLDELIDSEEFEEMLEKLTEAMNEQNEKNNKS